MHAPFPVGDFVYQPLPLGGGAEVGWDMRKALLEDPTKITSQHAYLLSPLVHFLLKSFPQHIDGTINLFYHHTFFCAFNRMLSSFMLFF